MIDRHETRPMETSELIGAVLFGVVIGLGTGIGITTAVMMANHQREQALISTGKATWIVTDDGEYELKKLEATE